MRKAKFLRKYYGSGYDRAFVYWDYEYHGHEYTVELNRAKGSEPLAWQHRNAQDRIDSMIEYEERHKEAEKNGYKFEDAQAALDAFLDYIEGDEHAFDKFDK